jgi:prepilin signal peptidase PulO-like enzyme (type II secretory pathway)
MPLAQITGRDLKYLESKMDLNFVGGNLGDIINALLPYLFTLAGLLLLLYLIYTGFGLMTSAGDPKKIQEAKSKLTNALLGFVIIFVAYWLVQIIGKMLGIEAMQDIFK